MNDDKDARIEQLQREVSDLRKDLEIAQLRGENQRLKKDLVKGLSLKISEKGALSVYGLGRFPVTLYKEQWRKLMDSAGTILAFAEDHEAELKTKGDPKATDEAKTADTPKPEGDGAQG